MKGTREAKSPNKEHYDKLSTSLFCRPYPEIPGSSSGRALSDISKKTISLFIMVANKKVGIALATAYEKDDIPEYEFPDSGYVKPNLTKSDLAILEEASSGSDLLSKSSKSSTLMRNEIVQIRLFATLAVLFSFGFICILLNCFVRYTTGSTEMKQVLLGIVTFAVGILTGDWYRLHGEKLTRALKALLNVSSILNSLDTFALDLLGISKRFKFDGKYILFPEDFKINEELPRTPEISPPLSPSNRQRNGTKNSVLTQS